MVNVILQGNKVKILKENSEENVNNILKKIRLESEISNLMNKIENEDIDGLNLKDIYLYDGIEVYNFCRGSICSWIRDILMKYLLIHEIFEEYKEFNTEIITDDIIYRDIAIELFKLKCTYKNAEESNKESTNRNKAKYYLMMLNRIIRGSFYMINKLLCKKKRQRILFVTQVADVNKMEINNNIVNYDAQFGYVIRDIKKDVVRMQYLNNASMIEKANKLGNDFIPFELFIIIKRKYAKKMFDESKVKDSLKSLSKFDFMSKGRDLTNILEKHLFSKMEPTMKSYVMEIITAKLFLEKFKIDCVLATDEADRTRCIIWAANKLNLKTFAIEHGIIADTSDPYMIPSENTNYIPKKTFLWGKVYKETLMRNTKIYNDSNLEVVGQPRTDLLINKLKFFNSEEGNHKLRILYATQSIWDLTEEATQLFLEAIKDLDNIEVLIKLHPADTYISFYEETVKRYGLTNVIITKDMDIYDAIIWSDLIVSVHSTVVIEAAIINKPSICILLSNYNDQGNFVKNGLSIGASNKEEMKNIISNRLYENPNLKDYVEDSFYKVDGKVSERILKVIEESH